MTLRGIWIDGQERPGRSGRLEEVTNPYDGMSVGAVQTASAEDSAEAVTVALRAFRESMRLMPVHERAAILRGTAKLIRDEAEDLESIVIAEVGKPIKDVKRELGRAQHLLDLVASQLTSWGGRTLPMDNVASGVNRFGYAIRVPLGVMVALAPSNSPVNLTLNKIAPALAVGNAVVLKPANQTPFSALWLANAFQRAGLPDGALNVVVGNVEEAAGPLVRDPRVRMVSITGGVPAGLAVIRAAGMKKVTLELGSSSANVVRADADIEAAAQSLAISSYLSSGQACIAAQRIIVHESVAEEFIEHFIPTAEAMVIGDPHDPRTDMGPMGSRAQVARVLSWIEEAKAAGAKVLTGGEEFQRTIKPTLMTDVPRDVTLATSEAFAPIAVLATFSTDEEAIDLVNDSVFGLQAGVFTNSADAAFRFAEEIEAGAVWVNDSSRYRQENYPFGGVKLSGVGREGLPYAMEDMTELKFIGMKLGPNPGLL